MFKPFYLIFILYLGVTLAAEVCNDINTKVCQEMNAAIPNMCSDSCLAAHCKRFCGACPLRCYECHEVDHPFNCSQTVVCPSKDHYCVATQTFTDDFREVYKLGCALNNLCAANFVENTILGRRDVRNTIANVAGGCCKTDRCNNRHPSHMTAVTVPENVTQSAAVTTTVPSNTCQDIPGNTCLNLALISPNICQSDCIASRVCPRTCGKCVECYTCAHVARTEDCNQTTVCQNNQECFSLATLSSSFEHGFRLGCMDITTCANFYKPTPNAFGRRQNFEVGIQGGCCHSDFCNHHAVKPTTKQPTTSTTTTTVRPHHTFCPSRYSRCPLGFQHYLNSCYLVGSTSMTWSSAQAYCSSRCAHLADFTDRITIYELSHYLAHEHKGTFYTAAQSDHGHWTWASTHRPISSSMIHTSHSVSECAVITTSSSTLTPSSCHRAYLPLCEIELEDD